MLEFAARVLEREGALVESAGSGLSAVLPAAAREALGLEEYSLLTDGAGGGVPCGYGSEALGKIARLALGPGRAAAFRADLPECTAQVPAGLVGINVSLRVAGAHSERRWTLIGLARYRASADDQREGLCRAAVGAPDGVPVPPPDLDLLPISPVAPGEVPEDVLRAALPRLLSGLKRQAVEDLRDFREAVARRRRRDASRLRRYFDEVESDLRRRLGRKGGEAVRGKLDSLPAELRQKLAQIEADSVVRVRVDLAGLVAVLGPGIAADLEVRRRKHTRSLEVRYDGISKRWAGLRCDGCGAAINAFALCDEAVHVLCARCWDSCGSGGHRPCFRCEGKPERGPWSG